MASRKNPITLCISSPGGERRESLSNLESVILGSGAGVAVKLADPQVSSFHLMLKLDAQGNLKAIDLGSDTGTRLGDQLLVGPTAVRHGDVLSVGASRIRVLFGDEPATKPIPIEPAPNRAAGLPPPQTFAAPPPSRLTPPPPPPGARTVPPQMAAPMEPRLAPQVVAQTPMLPQAPVMPVRPGTGAPRTNATTNSSVHTTAARLRRMSPAPMLFGELRPEVAPTERDKVLQVAMLWGDQVLNVRQFRDGVPVTIGGSTRHPFQLEAKAVGNAFTLAAAKGMKRVVNIPTDAEVVVRSNGRLRPADGKAIELGLNDRVQVSVDDLSFVLQYVKPSGPIPPGRRKTETIRFAAIALFMLLLGVSALVWMALAPKPDYSALQGMSKANQRMVKIILNNEQHKKRQQAIARRQQLEKEKGAEEGKKAKEEEGEMGKPTEEQPKKAEASKAGTQLTDEQRRERDRQKVNNTGLLSIMKGDNGSLSDVLGPGGHGGGLNTALGGLKSGGVGGDQRGVGGMGSRGTGRGGGGDGLTIGGLGTKGDGPGRGGSGFDLNTRSKDTVRVIPGRVIIEGGLPKDVIAQIIRSHEKEIKYCYELELSKDPSLAGKVAALFIIDGTGVVSEATVQESTLNSPPAERCMMQKIRRWRFPEPKGGGIVTVTYPWVFKPSAGAP